MCKRGIVFFGLFVLLIVSIIGYIYSDFRKNLKFYGFKVFKYYYHKKIVVPRQLKYKEDDEFHLDLRLNTLAMFVMSDSERREYEKRVMKLREEVGKHEL